jgi:hypothetical protein
MDKNKFNLKEIHNDCETLVKEIQGLKNKEKDKDSIITHLQ